MKTPQVPAMPGMAPLGMKEQKPTPCGFKLLGFMPPCILETGHIGDHTDGFGGYYGSNNPAEVK